MSWGCKQKPNGCGWAMRMTYPRVGVQDWSCEVCERDGSVAVPIEHPGCVMCAEEGRYAEDHNLGDS